MIVRKSGFRAGLAVISIVGLGLCSGCGNQVGIEAVPSELFVEVGGAETINVVTLMDPGASAPVTEGLTMTSSDPSVAGVAGLLVTGIAEGSAVLTITDGTFTTSADVTVVPPESIPAGLIVTPATITCTPESAPIQLDVFAVFPSGSSVDITDAASFRSNNSTIAVVTTDGTVICVSPGTTLARADYLGKFNSAEVTVLAVPPVSVTFIPSSVTCVVGETPTVLVRAVAADGTSTEVSETAIFTSSDNLVAAAAAGRVACLGEGNATITANVSGVLGTLGVDVRTVVAGPDELVGLSFLPESLTCGVSGSPPFVLAAEFGDGSTADVTYVFGTFYESFDSNVVLILNNQPICVQRGQTTLRAQFAGFEATAPVSVQ